MKNNKTYLLIIIGIYIATFIVLSVNLNIHNLWYDEAGQFFISKGLNHDSDPLEEEKGLIHVVENNAHYNLDPGGFSILLHFWSKISNSHIWLRILPFLFFIGVVLSFIYISNLWLKNLNIAILMGFIPIFYPLALKLGVEVRAFSMESLAAIISVIGLEKLKGKVTYKNLFFWSCVFFVFMTARYSVIIVIFVVSLYVMFLIFKSNSTIKNKLLSALVYSLPLITTLIYIYFFVLKIQNTNIETLTYLPYISNNISILFYPQNLLFLCIIGLLMVLFVLKKRYPIIRKYEIVLFVTISVNVLFIILSFLGKHPWDPYSSKCISLFLLVLLCGAALLGEFIKPLVKNSKILIYFVIVSALIFTLLNRRETFYLTRFQNNAYHNFLKTDIGNYERIYVDRWESPSIRYLLGYGIFSAKMKDIYPDKFTFGKYMRHSESVQLSGGDGYKILKDFYGRQPKMNDYFDYDLLITPELFHYSDGYNDNWTLLNGTTNFYIKKDNNINNHSLRNAVKNK